MLNNKLNKYKKITLLLIFISAVTLLPCFILLLASSWNSDDYYVAQLYQVEGLHGLLHRIFTWSPRFFSEIILYLYYNSVNWLGKPFAWGMILITWLFLISSIFIFTRTTIRNNSLYLCDKQKRSAITKDRNQAENIYIKMLLPLLITMILFIYFLYNKATNPNGMYYLVAVSVAYIPTLAGIIFNLNFFINQANSSNISNGNIFQFILLGMITSSSWEMGTVHQLFFSSCLFLLLLLTSFSKKVNYLPFSRLIKSDRWKLSIANLIPFIFSLYILFILQSSRLNIIENSSVGSPLARNFNSSFINAFVQFFKELFFVSVPAWENHNTYFYLFTYSFLYKFGFLLLLTILFYQVKIKFNVITRNAAFLSIIILVMTNFVITFSGYYQLGIYSPGRQISFKATLIGLIIVIAALIIASLLLSQSRHNITNKTNVNSLISSRITLLVSFCLTFTLIINLQFNSIKRDILNFNRIIISNNQNWQKNLDSSKSLAIYTQVRSRYVFRMFFQPGLYPACEHSDNERAFRYMNYFRKQKLYVTPFTHKAFSNEEIENKLNRVSQKITKSLKNKIYFTCFFAPGNVEKINQVIISSQVTEVNIDETLEISGWVINPDKSIPKRIIITVEDDEDLLVNTTLDILRPDIAQYFRNPSLRNSGWKATLSPKPEWDGQTLTFKMWAYNPDTNIANFSKDFTIRFSSNK